MYQATSGFWRKWICRRVCIAKGGPHDRNITRTPVRSWRYRTDLHPRPRRWRKRSCYYRLDPGRLSHQLHTLAVDPLEKGKGYGKAFISFYEAYAREHGCRELRIDTNAINQRARAMYQKLGYEERGIVPCVFNGIPDVQLVCLEKYLDWNSKELEVFRSFFLSGFS